jgi:hypothetical protein
LLQANASKKQSLSAKQSRAVSAVIRSAKGDGKSRTVQQSIPYQAIYPDGICKIDERHYSKTVAFEDINYQLAGNDDKTAAFENLCDFYNYFDSSIALQLTFVNRFAARGEYENSINIPTTGDAFDPIRIEYRDMLKSQLDKGGNGLIKAKFATFSIEADNLKAARDRLFRIESDVLNHFKVIGAAAASLNGVERLRVLHDAFHPNAEPFAFAFDWLAKTGQSTKDFIAPSSFQFGDGRTFRMGGKWGACSFLQILAPELNDRVLADLLEADTALLLNIHIRPVDQGEAIKMVKRKITDLDSMKINEVRPDRALCEAA